MFPVCNSRSVIILNAAIVVCCCFCFVFCLCESSLPLKCNWRSFFTEKERSVFFSSTISNRVCCYFCTIVAGWCMSGQRAHATPMICVNDACSSYVLFLFRYYIDIYYVNDTEMLSRSLPKGARARSSHRQYTTLNDVDIHTMLSLSLVPSIHKLFDYKFSAHTRPHISHKLIFQFGFDGNVQRVPVVSVCFGFRIDRLFSQIAWISPLKREPWKTEALLIEYTEKEWARKSGKVVDVDVILFAIQIWSVYWFRCVVQKWWSKAEIETQPNLNGMFTNIHRAGDWLFPTTEDELI